MLDGQGRGRYPTLRPLVPYLLNLAVYAVGKFLMRSR